MKKHIITLSGLPGSGKSTTAKRISELLDYCRFSSGDFMRQAAAQHHLSVDEFNRMAETNPSFDYEVDDILRKTGDQENIVIDSRLAYHWIPDSFKVFLKIEPHTAAERVFAQLKNNDGGRAGENASSIDEVYANMVARIDSERKRYAALYGVDYTDEKQFDLVVDTGIHPLEEVASIIVEKYKEWEKM